LKPVPPGNVTLSNKTISPGSKLCDVEVVIVQTGLLLTVAIVEELNVDFKGVISCSCPSKYKSKNLSVPNATYLFPFKSTKA